MKAAVQARGHAREQNYDYAAVLATSERVAFRLQDVLPDHARFDFTRPFLPESLAQSAAVPFLNARERLILNQVRAHSYLATFGLVEEFILPFVLEQLGAKTSASSASLPVEWDPDGHARTRALLQFAGEEAKHIELFKRFRARFGEAFGVPCEVIGPAAAVTKSVLAHGPLAVALTILHIEWMTQRHYLESVQSEAHLDPLFQSLLKHHFLEECQHAKLDTLLVHELARDMRAREVDAGLREYGEILLAFDGLIAQQVELDLRAFEQKSARVLTVPEIEALRRAQLEAARFTFLSAGLEHPRLRETVRALSDEGDAILQAAASSFA